MCGIAGFTTASWPVDERTSPAAATRLVAMTGALAHRGPDAQRGVLLDGVALGHSRLSIIDVEGGHQPMRDPQTGTCVVLNGEIFNYVELRDELHEYPFRTRSDTEVLIAAYHRWGIACVERFLGQWAFALWDPHRRELHLSRDRMGVRPLYYAETPSGVVFGSEMKALFASGFVEPILDPLAIKETTCLWTAVSPRTSFQGVVLLPPGCCGLVTDGRVRVRRYWTLDLSDKEIDPSLTVNRAAPLVAELLDDAVRLRLRADVPVGSYLSGGLDSSLICAVAQRRLRATASRLSTFSVAFSQAPYDESTFPAACGYRTRQRPSRTARHQPMHRRVAPRGSPPRGAAAGPFSAGAAARAQSRRMRSPHESGVDRRGRRRVLLGLRVVPGEQDTALVG